MFGLFAATAIGPRPARAPKAGAPKAGPAQNAPASYGRLPKLCMFCAFNECLAELCSLIIYTAILQSSDPSMMQKVRVRLRISSRV